MDEFFECLQCSTLRTRFLQAKVSARTYAISMFYIFILYIYLDAPRETKVIESSSSKDVKEGEKMTISCSSKANPKANFTWFKNDSYFSQLGENLILYDMTPEKGGRFYCQAKNDHGTENSHGININVICKYVCVIESISALYLAVMN